MYAILSQDLLLDIEGHELVIAEGTLVIMYENQIAYDEEQDVHFQLSDSEYSFIQ